MIKRFFAVTVLLFAVPVSAHDTWVETHTGVVRTGDAVHLDLKLGNHGNDHRDFRLAGKPNLEASKLEVIDPSGSRYDMVSNLSDTGYAPNEGYWTGKFVPTKPGLYMVGAYARPSRPLRAVAIDQERQGLFRR